MPQSPILIIGPNPEKQLIEYCTDLEVCPPHCHEFQDLERKINQALKNPQVRAMYHSRRRYARAVHCLYSRDEKKGRYGRWSNPKGFYDFSELGGNPFKGLIPLKPDAERQKLPDLPNDYEYPSKDDLSDFALLHQVHPGTLVKNLMKYPRVLIESVLYTRGELHPAAGDDALRARKELGREPDELEAKRFALAVYLHLAERVKTQPDTQLVSYTLDE
jgi:hypothetical protein